MTTSLLAAPRGLFGFGRSFKNDSPSTSDSSSTTTTADLPVAGDQPLGCGPDPLSPSAKKYSTGTNSWHQLSLAPTDVSSQCLATLANLEETEESEKCVSQQSDARLLAEFFDFGHSVTPSRAFTPASTSNAEHRGLPSPAAVAAASDLRRSVLDALTVPLDTDTDVEANNRFADHELLRKANQFDNFNNEDTDYDEETQSRPAINTDSAGGGRSSMFYHSLSSSGDNTKVLLPTHPHGLGSNKSTDLSSASVDNTTASPFTQPPDVHSAVTTASSAGDLLESDQSISSIPTASSHRCQSSNSGAYGKSGFASGGKSVCSPVGRRGKNVLYSPITPTMHNPYSDPFEAADLGAYHDEDVETTSVRNATESANEFFCSDTTSSSTLLSTTQNRSPKIRPHSPKMSAAGDADAPAAVELFQRPPALTDRQCAASTWKNKIVIILDWDDTIFPSSWIHVVQRTATQDDVALAEESVSGEVCLDIIGKNHLSPEQEIAITQIETSALALLRECQRQGRLHIITNAESGWVQLSASHFMPRVFAFLTEHKIPVISARACFNNMLRWRGAHFPRNDEGDFAVEPDLWKVHTFSSLLRKIVTEESIRCSLSPRSQSDAKLHTAGCGRRHVTRRVKFGEHRPEWSITRSYNRARHGLASINYSGAEGGNVNPCISSGIVSGIVAHGGASRHKGQHHHGGPTRQAQLSKRFHFLSIGDSECERRALLTCREELYPHAYFKSVKLVEAPHPTLLIRQQDLLRTTLANILLIADCVDLVFVEPTFFTTGVDEPRRRLLTSP